MKKLLSSLGTIAVGLTPIVAIVSCNHGDKENVDKKEYVATPIIPISDSRKITKTTNYLIKAENYTLKKDQMVNAILLEDAVGKETNEIGKSNIESIPITNGLTYVIELVVSDGILNTIINVRIKVLDNSKEIGKYVSSIPNLIAPKYNYQNGVLITSVVEIHNPRWIRANRYLGKRAKNNGFSWTPSHENKADDQKNAITTHVAEAKNESIKIYGITIGAKDSGAGGIVGTLGKGESNDNFPIVAYDRLIKASAPNYDWYTSFDGYGVGKYQGLAIAAHLVGHNKPFNDVEEMEEYIKEHKDEIKDGTFMLLVGSESDNNTTLFYNGEMDVLNKLIELTKDNEKGKIRLVGPDKFKKLAIPNWDADKVDEQLRTNYNNLDANDKKLLKAIVSPNDSFGLAAQATLKSLDVDVTKIYITGQDANPGSIVSIAKDYGGDMTLAKPDRLLSAINVGVIEGIKEYDLLNSSSKWNSLVDNSPTKTLAAEWIAEFVRTKNPTISFRFVKDIEKYSAGDKGKEGHKVIYSLLIDPILITKANYKEFFTVEEKK